jgi:uncharacterized protein
MLAEDDAADALAHSSETLAERVDLAGEVAGGSAEPNRRAIKISRGQAFRIAQRQNSSGRAKRRHVVNEAKADDGELARIEAAAATPPGAATKDRAPPRDCGHFDIHIGRDGSWFYRGTPINRASLVKLFSTVLERDAAGNYWLSTPAERGRVTVEDAPFLAVELDRSGEGAGQELIFRTNVGDFVTADADHPLRIETNPVTETPRPYIAVRNRLEARLTRPVFYNLVDCGVEERVNGTTRFGVWSKGTFFPLDPPGEPG